MLTSSFSVHTCRISTFDVLFCNFSVGMTQAIIPTLVKMGVSAVSVGVNPMTSPPAVPNPFVWRFNHSDGSSDSVIGLCHKGGSVTSCNVLIPGARLPQSTAQ